MGEFFDESLSFLHQAGQVGDIDPKVIELLEVPHRTVIFRIPLKMDDGSRRIFEAYRVHYNDALGPTRDGTRITPDLSLQEVEALGLLMCIKHAAGRIPAGGGKGGIRADPRKLSNNELERLCRAYIRQLRPQGPAYDIPGADIGTSGQTMAWMLDEYEKINGYHCPAAISDKPPILGGSYGGEEATGRGVFEVTEVACENLGLKLKEARVAIQGFGQVGSVVADALHQAGVTLVAVSDVTGGIYQAEGLDIPSLQQHVEENGTVEGFPAGRTLNNAELLECDCDILIPAAVQGVINEDNVDRIQASLIVEGANAPVTHRADERLRERDIALVPDVIANSGSVHVCQMERSQGLYDNYWDAETVDKRRRERVLDSYERARRTTRDLKLASHRHGAWVNALRQIAEAVHTRGWL